MLVALRSNEWKLAFAEQRAHGMEVDLFETADHEGTNYKRWRLEHLFLPVPAQQYVGQFLGTFKEFSPRHKTGSSASIRCWKA